jgi:putative ABC transport system substrate-binding protein
VIITRENEFYEKTHKALLSHLASKGQSKNHKFIIQRPHADPIAIRNAARKLVAVDVDAIVTYGVPATQASIYETSSTPIIFAGVYENIPESSKTRNVKGVCMKLPLSSLIRYVNNSIDSKSLTVIYSTFENDTVKQLKDIERITDKYGLTVTAVNLEKPADITSLLAGADTGAFIITSSSITNSVFPAIIRIAYNKGVPVASLLYHDPVTATFQLTSSPDEHGKRAGEKLLQLLKGTSIRNMTDDCSVEIELVFNIRKARELGLRIPMDLVIEATKVIY